MINKKNILYIVLILGVISCIGFGIKWHNFYTVGEDTAPLVFVDANNDMMQFYYLQNKELIENPIGSDVYSNYTRYDINKEKREEILFPLWDGVSIPAKYNYETEQMEKLGDNKELEEISSLYRGRGEKNEYRFIPGSSNVSFIIDDRIYIYKYEQKHYKQVYQFSDDDYGRLGFSYEWKNDEEIYLMKDGNFILHNIETKNEEIILEDIGKVYFQISDDGQYVTYQNGKRERRKLYLVDLRTMEKKEIHAIKTDSLVDAEFSSDNKYILIMDRHRDTKLGKRYFYLYDIDKEKKYRLDIGDLPLSKFVGWGKYDDFEDAETIL